jgi:hypothetical protein
MNKELETIIENDFDCLINDLSCLIGEEWKAEAIKKAVNKAFVLGGVSQQRELLTGFVRFERKQDYKYKLLPLSEKIEKYLASL